MLFAEADPLGGWMQVVLQAGAFGLLSYIVIVLYPRATKDARDERAVRDESFTSLVSALQEKFENRNTLLADSIREQTKAITAEMKEQTESISRAVSGACRNKG